MKLNDYKGRVITSNKTLIQAFRLMDKLDKKLLIVIDNNKFKSLISAGDIQRAIIHNKPMDTPISEIFRKNIRIASKGDSLECIKEMMFKFRMELCPVIDEKGQIEAVYFWEDLFVEKNNKLYNSFDNDVVIMAGGVGSRLLPLTNVLPKPLIPFGNKTIIESIFDQFRKFGKQKFYISVNYKADLIKYYLSQEETNSSIEFFKEDKPRGTAGSLSLLKGKINKTFFLTNCDILINEDYSQILEFHKENKNEITLVSAMKHYDIPYGTIVSGKNGELLSITEKPTATFKINCGLYILEPHLLNCIPEENSLFHITDLIYQVQQRKGRMGVFPISEKNWIDIGNWKDYNKIIHGNNENTFSNFL